MNTPESENDETLVHGTVARDTRLREMPEAGTRLRPGGVETVPAPAPAAFGPGYRLRGRYVLDELIGQGTMGQVWRAKDLLGEEARDRNPYVAVKVLNSDFESHPDAFVALHREAVRAQKLAHPNIVTVHVFDRDDHSGRAFIAMELLQGKPLDRVIREAGAQGLPRARALPIIRGMAEGLAHAHRKGIVHSDFKPANVFLTNEGVPKILDFGIARAVQVAGVADTADSADEGGFQGYTPGYAAPEALSGHAEPSLVEDVFSLGIVAFELSTGQHPFGRLSAPEARAANLQRPALRGLKRREARAIEHALSFDPARRTPNATAFLRELQGVPVIQQALIGAVTVLVLTAGGLWYNNHRLSMPDVPLEQLPAAVQQQFREKVQCGNDALGYVARTHDVSGSADAASCFADAFRLHPKDPDAVRGLDSAADLAIDWYRKMPDRRQAVQELRKFRERCNDDACGYYRTYAPLSRAIRDAGGE
ncbi:MAG TPA: serine/threonine-protein kinase [Steroidobacteraceae bacterium]|nr:serine/threonine-protein kinase [Steroidobacteraceae bacterium]